MSSFPAEQDSLLEWLKVTKAELQVCVHPAWANNVHKGVQENLNALLFRRNEDLDGVVLAYLDLKIPSARASILPGLSPYFRVNISAKLLIFSPKIGMMLEGKVNKIEGDYVGVLVLGIFNAAIGVSDIREGFQFSEENFERAWINENEQQSIKLGTVIRFLVKSLEEKDDFLDIAGSLMPSNTGSVERSLHPKANSSSKEGKQKQRKRKETEHKFSHKDIQLPNGF